MVDIEKIRDARERISPHLRVTPVLTCRTLDVMSGASLYFKCENFQRSGAFKARGAINAVFSLSEEDARRGVATHSSGNHAGALAMAAARRGVPAYIVMPRNAPEIKKSAVAGYGAKITFCEPTLEARESTLERVAGETGATFIHPYDDPRVIAGQGTAAMELLEEVERLDIVITPVGGGGLLSGTAITVAALSPATKVYAGEPEGADDAYRSLEAGRLIPSVDPDTVADGLLTSLSERTFGIIREHVAGIERVADEEIVGAMRLIWERMKIVVEPSAAVPLAAILSGRIDIGSKRVGVVLSGGNVRAEIASGVSE